MKPSVTVEVGGKVHNLRLTMNSIAALEAVLGKTFGGVLKGLQHRELNFRDLRVLMWASLYSMDPDITVDAAGDFFDQLGPEAALEKLSDVVDLYVSGDQKNAPQPTGRTKKESS